LEGEEAVADRLVSLLKTGDADAIVRGQVYYTNYHEALKREYGFKRDLMCPCLIRDLRGNEWFITPVVHHDEATIAGRCYLATQAAKICLRLGVSPEVGVLAADSERGYLSSVDKSLDDAAAISAAIQSKGYESRVYPLLIDRAVSECNIVVPMDGILGNFICRSLVYLGGATMVGGFGLRACEKIVRRGSPSGR